MLVFFINFNSSTLLVTELIGTTTTPCILAINSNLHSPAGVFIVNNTIYWSNFYNKTLFKGTLRSNNILDAQQITGGSFIFPNGISVDTENNRIYWANQEGSNPNTSSGSIFVGDLSDIVITNEMQLNIPDNFINGPAGLFIDYNTDPFKIYWTNYLNSTMYVGDLVGQSVSNIRVLTVDSVDNGLLVLRPTGIFVRHDTQQFYWTNEGTNAIYFGDLSDSVISNIGQITGPTFSAPSGIFMIEGSLSETDPLMNVCDTTCEGCVGLFVQFSDLIKKSRPTLDLSNSDDSRLLLNALNLTQIYCMKMDWKHSSVVGGSARELVRISTTPDSDLDPIHREIKQALLAVNHTKGDCY